VGIVNKRNALLGWLTWRVGKRLAKKKARGAVPGIEGGRPNKSALAAGVAALAGTLFFWRKSKGRRGERGAE
jgi:hypothetical protein